jgi:hypothetical protein
METKSLYAVKHSGQLGDIIYSLPFLRTWLSARNDAKAIFMVTANKRSSRRPDIVHLAGAYMLNESMYSFIRPLIAAQDYIHDVVFIPEERMPENILDLDIIRSGVLNLSAGYIRSYYFKIFGYLDRDAGPWLKACKLGGIAPEIVISRSTRYLNLAINYQYLTGTGASVGFIGTQAEFNVFRGQNPSLEISHLDCQTSMDAMAIISKSKLFIGNQSLFFAIAEGLQHPRLLEVFEPVPNVVPAPCNSGCFLNNTGLMRMVGELGGFCYDCTSILDTQPRYVVSIPL